MVVDSDVADVWWDRGRMRLIDWMYLFFYQRAHGSLGGQTTWSLCGTIFAVVSDSHRLTSPIYFRETAWCTLRAMLKVQ